MSFTADAVSSLPGPEWLASRRHDAYERFRSASLPTSDEEVWRYSRVSDLDLDAFHPAGGDGGAPRQGVPEDASPLLRALEPRSGLIVLRDGRVAHSELDAAVARDGVGLAAVSGASGGAELLGSVAAVQDPFVDLASAFVADPVLVEVPARTHVREPLVVLHWLESPRAAVFPRTVVRVAEGAEATVVELVASVELGLLVVPVAELAVGDGARLGYMGLQLLGADAWQVGYQASRVGRDAALRSFSVAMGGSYARLRTDSRLVGQGGSTNLLAAYFGAGDQMHDFRTLQDHDAPKTTSDLLFGGAVRDRAQAVYSGLIRVRPGATSTNAFQNNRNLVLSEGARTHSVPNLDIQENDVRCSHASTVGPVDEDQRYYLESRGIPPAVAERLIVLGFFDDLLAKAPLSGAAAHVRSLVAAKLGRGGDEPA